VVVTGISKSSGEAKPAAEETEKEWTTEELKAGKPMLVYYFVPTADPQDENYKFSRKFEMGVLQEKNVDKLNAGWRKKKIEIDVDADHAKEKNQAHIEFWSFTGKKLGDVTLKEQNQLNAGPFGALLIKYERMNRDLCSAEIKRLEAAKSLREKVR
jgi:hypothetical protein